MVNTSVKLSEETVLRLKAIAHPGQSLDGIIRELLEWWEKQKK